MICAHILAESIFDIALHVPTGETASVSSVADGAEIKPDTPWNSEAFPGYIFLKADDDHHRRTDPVDIVPEIRLKE
ncbi:MAG: hypothetical protein ACI4NM_04685 [Bullifex sp.]